MLVLCGKLCAGKATIKEELLKIGMNAVIPYTTRPMRSDEKDGVDYHFISRDEFIEKFRHRFFAETAPYNFDNCRGSLYGFALEDLTDDKVIIVNPESLVQLRRNCDSVPVVFYIQAGEEVIRDRMKKCGYSDAEIELRADATDENFASIIRDVDFSFDNSYLKPELVADMIMYTYNKVMGEVQNMRAQEAKYGN